MCGSGVLTLVHHKLYFDVGNIKQSIAVGTGGLVTETPGDARNAASQVGDHRGITNMLLDLGQK